MRLVMMMMLVEIVVTIIEVMMTVVVAIVATSTIKRIIAVSIPITMCHVQTKSTVANFHLLRKCCLEVSSILKSNEAKASA